MVFVLGLSLAAQGGECPDRDALLTQGQTALVQGQLTEAQLALEAFHLTFDCETPVSSEDLGRFALLQGAVYFFDNQLIEAQHHFRLAHQLDSWDPIYGPQLHQQYLLSGTVKRNRFRLSVQFPHRYQLMIDGSEHSPETTLDANYHLIQILDPKGAVYSSQFEHLQSDRLITISPPPNVKRPLLAVSLGGIICSSTAFALALQQNTNMERSTSLDELNSAYQKQQVYSAVGWTTLGIAGFGGMLSLFW